MRMLSRLLTRFIRNGTMRMIDAAGGEHLFGGSGPGPTVTLRLHDPALYRKLALNPELYAGEAYMCKRRRQNPSVRRPDWLAAPE
jgi:cyclopropane-fatty-acyl-phospholipid synthase